MQRSLEATKILFLGETVGYCMTSSFSLCCIEGREVYLEVDRLMSAPREFPADYVGYNSSRRFWHANIFCNIKKKNHCHNFLSRNDAMFIFSFNLFFITFMKFMF